MKCPNCGVLVAEVGITVEVRTTRLYMRESFGEELVLAGVIGTPELERVRCRQCLHVLPAKCIETLKLQEVR